VYYFIVTTTTVGYGDIVPATSGGKAFAAIWSIFGLGGVGVVVGLVANAVKGKIASIKDRLRSSHEAGRRDDVQRLEAAGGEAMTFTEADLPFYIRDFALYASIFVWVALMLVGAAVFQATERTYYDGYDPKVMEWTFSNAVWFTYISLVTVGYGDFYVMSTAGKVLLPLYLFCALGVVSLVIGEVSERATAFSRNAVARAQRMAASIGIAGELRGEMAGHGEAEHGPKSARYTPRDPDMDAIKKLLAAVESIRMAPRDSQERVDEIEDFVKTELRAMLLNLMDSEDLNASIGLFKHGALPRKEKEALMRRNLARLEEEAQRKKEKEEKVKEKAKDKAQEKAAKGDGKPPLQPKK
jgi:hypothetical protein